MTLLLTKADLRDYTRLSQNVDDFVINPPIRDAHTFDVLPQLRPAEVEAMRPLVGIALAVAAFGRLTPEQQTATPLTGLALAYYTYTLLPEAEQALDGSHALYHLYFGAVRPLLSYHTYRHYLLDAGVSLAPSGPEQLVTDGTRQPIPANLRLTMRADAEAKCSHYQAVLVAALRSYRGATDSSCGSTSTRRPRTGGLTMTAI